MKVVLTARPFGDLTIL